jgi:hypothetical protein
MGACGDDGGAEPSLCGFEDRYLPYQAGYSWNYRVTDLVTGETPSKTQSLTLETDATFGEVIIQTTSKATGTTVSALKLDQDAVLRLRQEDRNMVGDLERTTLYDPGQIRLDEAADKLVLGAEWDESYSVEVTDAAGGAPVVTSRTDHWKVLGVDEECSSPLGTFSCLHVQRTRTVGGVSDKEFFFAKGIGKVKEANANQLEELISCQ